jgi:hypothetical protein
MKDLATEKNMKQFCCFTAGWTYDISTAAATRAQRAYTLPCETYNFFSLSCVTIFLYLKAKYIWLILLT